MARANTRNAPQAFAAIANSRTLVPGQANAFEGHKATNRIDKLIPAEIFFAQDIEQCYILVADLGSAGIYELAFQCRVDQTHVWETGNGQTWFVVDEPQYVRPYGFVVREKKN